MRRRLFVAMGLAAFAFLAVGQEKPADRSIKVKLNYTGTAAKVDASHKIYVFLFDSPEFMQGSVGPFTGGSATAKDETVTISGISAPVIYVVAAFDPKGAYDGTSGPPPTGSSMGIYSKQPGQPAPVNLEAGKPAQIELTFDDSTKMP